MEKSIFNITEYFENQDIDFQGITSFKVQNNGESTVDINEIPVYPGKTLILVEADSTFCDFNLKAVFTEEGKLPKFKAIYKQLESESGSTDNLHPDIEHHYTVTLYSYDKPDVVEFSQNQSGHTFLMRSFEGFDIDGNVNFDPAHEIDLGYVEANQVFKYAGNGSFDTTIIAFRNNDVGGYSDNFIVGTIAE
jgi:hypothetical protein